MRIWPFGRKDPRDDEIARLRRSIDALKEQRESAWDEAEKLKDEVHRLEVRNATLAGFIGKIGANVDHFLATLEEEDGK